MFRSNKILMAFSLIFAIALWMYVMGVEDPSTTRSFANVKVTVANEAVLEKYGYEVTNKKDLYVNVTVKAPRTGMKKVKDGDLRPYVKLRNLKTSSQKLEVKVLLPSEAKLTNIDKDEITVKIRKKQVDR